MAGLKRRTGERVIEQLRTAQSERFYELNFELQVPVDRELARLDISWHRP